MKRFLIIILLLVCSTQVSWTQGVSDDTVAEYLKYVAHGRVAEVKMKLPDLLAEYPNDPGVKLLHAVVIEDASKALEIYVLIIQDFPNSQWADDAYWRVIQYYAIMGNIEKAKFELDNFRKRYPASAFLGPATDVVSSAERIIPMREEVAAGRTVAKATPPANNNIAIKKVYEEVPPVTKEDTPKPVAVATSPAKTPAATPVANSTPVQTSPNSETKYGLQVGVFRDLVRAESEKEKYDAKRIRTTIAQREVNGEIMYAVVVGDYSSKDRAEKAKKIVERECDCKPIVIQK